MTSGCPNCEPFLELAGSSDAVAECTSQVFDGLITVAETKKSWVARWQRLEGYAPGVYAVKVEGTVSFLVAAKNSYLLSCGIARRSKRGRIMYSKPIY
jgi:transcription elongation factor SPT4